MHARHHELVAPVPGAPATAHPVPLAGPNGPQLAGPASPIAAPPSAEPGRPEVAGSNVGGSGAIASEEGVPGAARREAAMARFVEGPTSGPWIATTARLRRQAHGIADRFRRRSTGIVDDTGSEAGTSVEPTKPKGSRILGNPRAGRRGVVPAAWVFAAFGALALVLVVALVAVVFAAQAPGSGGPFPRSASSGVATVPLIAPATGAALGTEPGAASGADSTGATRPGTVAGTTGSAIVVHAAGAVVQPGLYRLPTDSRVADLVRAAGGLAVDADDDRINLAASVADGIRVYVPRRGEVGAPPTVSGPNGVLPPGSGAVGPVGESGSGGSSASGSPPVPVGPINVNTATVEQLDTLPGVGPSTAQAIVAHRQQHGAFTSVEQLQDVRGIGPSKLSQIRSLVVV